MLKINSESCDRAPAPTNVATHLCHLSLRDANPDAAHLLYGRPSPAGRAAGREQRPLSFKAWKARPLVAMGGSPW